MKLKALTIGLALSFPLLAGAQSTTSVTLYGTIDTALEYVNKIPEKGSDGKLNGNAHSSFHMTTTTGSVPSNWGIRGTEKISENLNAVFHLESGFTPGTGAFGQGRAFGRQAWVGLKGDWGQIGFGRQYNMLFWASLQYDIMGPNSFGMAVFDNYLPNTRMDNSVTYRGTFSGVTVGAAYARGRDSVAGTGPATTNCDIDLNNQSACQAYSFMLAYDAPSWGVSSAYDVMTGSDNKGTYSGLNEPSLKDKRLLLSGYFKINDLKLAAGVIKRDSQGQRNVALRGDISRSDLWSIGAAYPLTQALVLDGAVYYIRFKNSNEGDKATYYTARTTYSLSKRTAVYASVAYVNNKGLANFSASSGSIGANPEAGGNQTGVMAGLRHRF